MATSAGILFGSYSMHGLAAQTTYTVKAGETLWRVASLNNITVQNLMTYNNLTSSTIHIGQQLTLNAPSTQDTVMYTVKSGDSLSLIARTFNTTVTELKSINQLTSDLIRVGQTLKIPAAQTVQPIQSTNTTTYTVKSKDTLTKIALAYHLTVSELKSLNNLNNDTIFIGQVLKVNSTSATPDPQQTDFNVDAIIAEAKKYIGVPYVWGGSTPSGFDCSGYINYVFTRQGISVPRTVAQLWASGAAESTPQLGDLVFFGQPGSVPTHAGIYIGNNQFIHSGTSTGVAITDLNHPYWKPLFSGVKRIIQ